MKYTAAITKPHRHFLPEQFDITDWNSLEPYFKDLLDRKIQSKEDLEHWLRDMSELESVVSENACWRQIRMTCDTENKDLEKAFNFFMLEIQPKIQPYADQLNRKLVSSPFFGELNPEKYFTYLRNVRKSIDLCRKQNIPIQAELNVLAQHFVFISGQITVQINNKEYTLQQANAFLENPERAKREEAYRKIQERRLKDKDALNDLYSNLIARRHQVALNAGFKK